MKKSILFIIWAIIFCLIPLSGYSSTPTSTFTLTNTPTLTATLTASPTFTPTYTSTPTFTPTPTSTITPTFTITLTATITSTTTLTPTLTSTISRTPTTTVTPLILEHGKILAYPSPAKGDYIWFYYSVEGPAEVKIDIFNVAGEKGKTLNNSHSNTGYHRTQWNIRQVAPGIYFYRIQINDSRGTHDYGIRKLVIVK